MPQINSLAVAFHSILIRRVSGFVAAETMQFILVDLARLYCCLYSHQHLADPVPCGLDWALLLALARWGWSGHEFLTQAHEFAPANILMPYSYSFIMYLTITSYHVFDHIADQWTLIGAGIFVVSGSMIW
ncbi:MAG: hypothetical protein JKY94_05945 [Rhodobacteraceae bacterium]|nr:hypothetical protein [Paracoccaceae bacterium]